MQSILRGAGYELEIAHDGAEAVQQALQHAPGLILMDVEMPLLNGFEACRRLRTVLKRRVPIIFVTSRSEAAYVREGFEAGADGYLTKPVSPRARRRARQRCTPTAANAELALRRAAERPIAVVVLDLNLPGTSGLELMALFPRPRPPIVICSALAAQDAAMALAALEAGAVDVIGKPELDVHDYLEGAAERIVGAVRQALRERSSPPARSTPPVAGAATTGLPPGSLTPPLE